jgi:amicyanin
LLLPKPFKFREMATMKIRTIFSLLVLLAATSDVASAANPAQIIDAATAPPDAVKIDIAKMKYAPAAVEVEEGAVVTWTNHDAVPHNVFIGDIEVVGDMLRAGQTLAIRFNTAGDYNYICTPHPFMKGRVTVKPKS